MLQDEQHIKYRIHFKCLIIIWWESPSLLNPYDFMCDIIVDITTNPKTYKRWSSLLVDIQNGENSDSIHQFASGLCADPPVNILSVILFVITAS